MTMCQRGHSQSAYETAARLSKKYFGVCQNSLEMSPIVNSLEMSPFCVVVFSLECALKRSPAVRAKRKCAFQRGRCGHLVRNPGLHVLITLPPRMVVLSFPHHNGPGGGVG